MPSSKPSPENTPIVTFYSYKGGVGRSMAVLNVAALLASRGFRVLIIDFDLEAPGLSHLVLPKGKTILKGNRGRPGKGGLVELLSDARERGLKSHLFSSNFSSIATRYTFSYKIPKVLESHPDARLSIMPAGIQDDNYSARLHRLNLAGLYEEGLGKPLIEHFRNRLITSGLYEYILIDSRTGHSDEAGICTRDLADHRMVVSGLNTQNIEGTAAFLRSLRSALVREKKPLRDPDIILSPVPNSEDDLIARRERAANIAFNSAWQRQLPQDLLIPYHPRLALSEEAYVPTITASPLRSAYLAIEERFRRSLGHLADNEQARFFEHLYDSDGRSALITLRRWLKLSGQPGRSGSFKLPFGPAIVAQQGGDLLKKLLSFAEALEILELWIPSTDNRWQLSHIMKSLHRIDKSKADKLNKFILSGDYLSTDDLGAYAVYLSHTKKDNDEADRLYKRSLDALPNDAHTRFNYGQSLLGQGKINESLIQFRQGWGQLDKSDIKNTAEAALSMWLACLLDNSDFSSWERAYKMLLSQDFERSFWSFDAILSQAETKLSREVFNYAKALVDAFLKKSKADSLEMFARWTKLVPLDPQTILPDGTIVVI